MAELNDPLVTLTADAKKEIDKLGKDIERSEGDMSALEELGLDVSRLRDKINWAKKAREIILKRMT